MNKGRNIDTEEIHQNYDTADDKQLDDSHSVWTPHTNPVLDTLWIMPLSRNDRTYAVQPVDPRNCKTVQPTQGLAV